MKRIGDPLLKGVAERQETIFALPTTEDSYISSFLQAITSQQHDLAFYILNLQDFPAGKMFSIAVEYGYLWIIDLLLPDNRVNPADNYNDAIAVAAKNGHTEVVKRLLLDPRVNPDDDCDPPPILLAAKGGHIEVVKLLLNDSRLLSVCPLAVEYAVKNANVELVKLFLSSEKFGQSQLECSDLVGLAAMKGHAAIVELLLTDESKRFNPAVDFADDFDSRSPIVVAAKNGHIEVVKLLLPFPRQSIGCNNNLVFGVAAREGHIEIVRLLLTVPRINPAYDNNFAIYVAAKNGHTEVVRLLLADPRINPADDANFAIYAAANNDNTEVMRLLISDARVPKQANYLTLLRLNYKAPKIYAMLESYNPANKGFLNAWDRRKDSANIFSTLPEEIKVCIAGFYIDLKALDFLQPSLFESEIRFISSF